MATQRMGLQPGRASAAAPALAGVVGGLMVAATVRQGAFYPADAVLVAVGSVVITTLLLAGTRDKRTVSVVAATTVLALWWFARAAVQGRAAAFLPLGASMLGFGCAFLATRRLTAAHRQLAAKLVVAIGAVSAAVGLVATAARWYPLAMPAQNLWRLSTTLTYSNAAGALLAIALLVALGLDLHQRTTRLMLCLCAAGLVATQSRGAALGAVVGLALVPWAQLRRSLVVLALGLLGGLAVVATSNGPAGSPLAAAAVVVAVVIATAVPARRTTREPGGEPGRKLLDTRQRLLVAGLVAVAGVAVLAGAGLVLRVPIERRVALGSSEDRSYEWSAAFDQWRSAPVVGVGPDQLLHFEAPDGNLAHFAHNEYLQILADGGLVGALLLLLVGGTVVRATRRLDTSTSCAAGAVLAFAVMGALDFDWHLAALGLVGGWVAGLAGPACVAEAGPVDRSTGAEEGDPPADPDAAGHEAIPAAVGEATAGTAATGHDGGGTWLTGDLPSDTWVTSSTTPRHD